MPWGGPYEGGPAGALASYLGLNVYWGSNDPFEASDEPSGNTGNYGPAVGGHWPPKS